MLLTFASRSRLHDAALLVAVGHLGRGRAVFFGVDADFFGDGGVVVLDQEGAGVGLFGHWGEGAD